jgi:prepilin-type N-terminal cleavage/methylation domain-containing protein
MTKKQKGFTLVELMIVVAIIGVLAAVAIPKFADMLEKSREGATKGNLSAIKSAISNYYADQQGIYPNTLDTQTMTVSGASYPAFISAYMETLPGVKVTGKSTYNATADQGKGPGTTADQAAVYVAAWSTAPSLATLTTSAGKAWRYDNSSGNFWVNSAMRDMSNKSYTVYGFE